MRDGPADEETAARAGAAQAHGGASLVIGVEAARRLRASRLLRQLARSCPSETFLTGGSLRDRLMGLATRDLDLVVMGDPRTAARRLATAFHGSVVPLGKAPRMTFRVVSPTLQLDVWRPEGSIEADIRRRDFTINAIFWRLPNGPLVDLVGGLEDLEAGRIRAIAEANLRADPLRALRALRLAATRPRLRLTAETESLLARTAPLLPRVARERILYETGLLLAGPAVARAVATAARLGIFAPLLPGWADLDDLTDLPAVATRLAARVRSGHGALRSHLRGLLPAILAAPAAGFPTRWDAAAAEAALTHLGLSHRTSARIAAAAALGERLLALPALHGRDARVVALDAGADLSWALGWVLARRAAPDNDLEEAARRLLRWAHRLIRRPPPLDGAAVAELLDLPPGPLRAQAVHLLRRGQALGGVRSSRQAAAWLSRHWPPKPEEG